jgi:hypothetical protein
MGGHARHRRIGALVLKARAAVEDSRDPQRHHTDLAFLSGLIADPVAEAALLDAKERRSLRKVGLMADERRDPWVFLATEFREAAMEAWATLTG